MNNTFPYTSLHDYLDAKLSHIDNPTHSQIKEAKREYWKQYYTHYRRQKRKVRKEYTLGFTPDCLRQIKQKKGKLSVSEFLYKTIEQAISSNPIPLQDTLVLRSIDRQLMHLIDLMEELLTSNSNILNEQVLEQIEVLEQQFSQTFKSEQ